MSKFYDLLVRGTALDIDYDTNVQEKKKTRRERYQPFSWSDLFLAIIIVAGGFFVTFYCTAKIVEKLF